MATYPCIPDLQKDSYPVQHLAAVFVEKSLFYNIRRLLLQTPCSPYSK